MFGITFEKQQRTEQSDHVKKVRVLLIREDSLLELQNKTIRQVEFQSDTEHHKMRFEHLQLLKQHWEWKKKIRCAVFALSLVALTLRCRLFPRGRTVGYYQ